MFTDNGKNLAWGADISYHFTLENNTFINFSTRSTGRKLFDLRYLPGGSTITVKRNLFVLTKAEGDNRNLYFEGMDIRSIGGNGQITFDIQDNYSVGSESKFCQVDGIYTSSLLRILLTPLMTPKRLTRETTRLLQISTKL